MAPLATILTYHDVREPGDSRWPRRYASRQFLRPADLALHLDRLIAAGRPVVSLAAIAAALAGGPALPEGALALCFDHGLADHYRTVLPLLVARGLTAAFFLPAAPVMERRVITAHKLQFVVAAAESEQDVVAAVYDLVAEHRRTGAALPAAPPKPWDEPAGEDWSGRLTFVTRLLRSGLPAALRDEVIERLFFTFVDEHEAAFADDLYLTVAQARALADSGMTIGGYGRSATNLQGLPYRAQLAEISASARFLAKTFGRHTDRVFAYPQGGWDEATLELLPAQGFSLGLTGHHGRVQPGADPLLLPRIDGAQDFHQVLI